LKVVVLGTRGFPDVPGGVEKHCEHLYTQLVKKGCEVVVLARKPYVGEEIIDYKGVRVAPLPCPKNKSFEAFLHTFYGVFAAKRYRPDILHIHAVGPSLFVPLARFLGLKVAMTHHGPDYERKKWGRLGRIALALGEHLGAKYANSVISISQSTADRIRKRYKRDVAVIPNGVMPAQIAQGNGFIDRFGLSKGKYILAVGRFVPEKGFGDLIEAFEIASLATLARNDEGKKCKLVIVGDADHPDKYSLGLKEKAGKNKDVVLTGFLSGEPLRQLYSNAGLFVLPSYYEGLPIVLLEAMSFGLSCIASEIPANREVRLSEDRLFKAGDVQGLAKKIGEFVDKPLSDEEKNRQINMVAERYDWERIADRTLEVYGQVVSG